MRSVWLSCFSVLLLSGCIKPTDTKVPSYEEAKLTAQKEAPFVSPPIEERYKLKCLDKPVVVQKTDAIPFTGLLFTNDRAECLRAQIAERDRLREELEAERLKGKAKEIITTAALQRSVELSRQSWWDRHGGTVLFSVGAAIGMAITISILYAVTGGKSITVNPHITIH